MEFVGSADIKHQILMLGQIIDALAEHDHLDMLALRQDIPSSLPPLARGSLDSETLTTGVRVRALLRARRLRDEVFGRDLFADPAWDMLLDLMAARLEHTQVSVSSLCIAASVPPTTALRWLRQLTERGLVQREADPEDGRRVFVALSHMGAEAMMRWLRESRAIFANMSDASEAPRPARRAQLLTETAHAHRF